MPFVKTMYHQCSSSLVQQRGDWQGPSPPTALLSVPNVTAHTLMASVLITVLLFYGLLLCSLMCPQRVNRHLVPPYLFANRNAV